MAANTPPRSSDISGCANACPPRLPSGGSKVSGSSGGNSSRSRARSSSIGERVAFCIDKMRRAVTPERRGKPRSREVSPVSVTVRPQAERCWEEAESPTRMVNAEQRRATPQPNSTDMTARFKRSNSLAELLQEEASAAEARSPGQEAASSSEVDVIPESFNGTQPPGVISDQTDTLESVSPQYRSQIQSPTAYRSQIQSPTAAASVQSPSEFVCPRAVHTGDDPARPTISAASSSRQCQSKPQGGVVLDVDFCAPTAKAKGPPAAVLARLSKAAGARNCLPTVLQAEVLAEVAKNNSQPQGGVALDIDFCGAKGRVKGPPPAVLARLSRGSAARTVQEGPADQKNTAANRARNKQQKRTGSSAGFFEASVPTEYLATNDILELEESVVSHVLTTEPVKLLCNNLRTLDAAGVKTLIAWRMGVRHEQATGKLLQEEEVAAMCQAEAVQIKSTLVTGSTDSIPMDPSGALIASQKAADNCVQQALGVEAAMSVMAESRAGEEDKDILEGLATEIERLNRALKEPGLTSAQSYAIRKQLATRRSEKARAERAVRKGRKAQLEISEGQSAVQAIVDGLPTAARGSRQPGQPFAPSLDCINDGSDGPPRFQHMRTPQAQDGGALLTPRPPGFATTEAPPTAGSAALILAVLLHPETLCAAGSSTIGRLGLACKEFKGIALDCLDPGFGDTAWRCVCQCFARENALWFPKPSSMVQQGYWHKVMFEELWPARMKWISTDAAEPRRLGEMGLQKEQATHDFKIQVSVRFKPGSVKQSRLLVPLHQKLLLLRKSGVDIGTKLGNKEPPEFLDDLMGHVMLDPVLLPSSGKVCDRCVVQEQLRLRGEQDPFDGTSLTVDMLQPQEELCQRIAQFRADAKHRASDGGEEHKLDDAEVHKLISELGGDLDPDIVEMLLEADQLRAAGKRALHQNASRRQWKAGESEQDEEGPENENAGVEGQAWWEEDVQGLGAANAAMPAAGERVIQGRGMQETVEEELGDAPSREGPKLLAVFPPTRAVMFQPGAGIRPFVFARVFDAAASQEDVYENTARGSVCAAVNGFNACLLCYGQTGAGKTHTMFGQSVACGGNAGAVVSQNSGSVMRSLGELFNAAAELEASCDVRTHVSAQYVQVYQNEVTCLLTGNVVLLREATAGAPVLLQGAAETHLEGLFDASKLISTGEERKRYAETAMNHRSSRAHTVLAVRLTQRRGDLEVTSQLHLVDLAGSERVKKSRAQNGRLVEAIGINSSLSVLGQCIAARVEERPHVPYYESRLTLLLRSALGGNSRTAAIICCHKEDKHGDETLQALSFGERCALISNRANAAMASSVSEAAAAIDEALAECSRQIQGLEARGKGHLPACEKLRKRHTTLARRRRELADRVASDEVSAAVADSTEVSAPAVAE